MSAAVATTSTSRQGQRGSRRTPVERKYFRPTDLVELTGLSRSTIYEALMSGDLTGRKVRGSWLIDREAVDAWLQGN